MNRNAMPYLCIFIVFVLIGCGKPENKQILVKVNNYEMTVEEFEEEFKSSGFLLKKNNKQARIDFLQHLINTKLILQDAQNRNFDKEKSFLKAIEKFWEQSLLKVMLDRKEKELQGQLSASDAEMKAMYDKMVQAGEVNQSFAEVQSQIKWFVIKQKEMRSMDGWVEGLKNKAAIVINYGLLVDDQGGK